MARNSKKKVCIKARVRFCSIDVYRYLITDEKSKIVGIENYETDGFYLNVYFSSGKVSKYDIQKDDKALKMAVKEINKYLQEV